MSKLNETRHAPFAVSPAFGVSTREIGVLNLDSEIAVKLLSLGFPTIGSLTLHFARQAYQGSNPTRGLEAKGLRYGEAIQVYDRLKDYLETAPREVAS